MSPEELAKEISSGKFRPVYYFYGSEDYRIREAEKVVAGRFLPKPLLNTNQFYLSAVKDKFGDILTALSIIPMLGERQIFFISDIQKLSEEAINQIISLLQPPDLSRLVICSSPSDKMPGKKTKMYKFLVSQMVPVEFAHLRQDSARNKIMTLLEKGQVGIDPDALELLVELGGGDLGGLLSEVDKLVNFVGENGRITRQEISRLTSDYQAYEIYDPVKHALQGDYDKAMATIEYLINRGNHPTLILFWLSEHIIGLYLYKNRKPFGDPKKDISWKFKGQYDLLRNEDLEEIIVQIGEADREIRHLAAQDRLILERLVLFICQKRNRAADTQKSGRNR